MIPSENPSAMQYGRIDGIEVLVSRMILGTHTHTDPAHAEAMYDDFFERGGTAFDTAYVYAEGKPERFLGQWIAKREIRSKIAVVVKGAHAPHCQVDQLASQLNESLDRLGLECADLYLMHHDNLDVPVGEFVEALNGHHRAGRVRSFGVSNWPLERLQEAQAYAAQHRLRPFSAISHNFSLARMVAPVWDGSVSAKGPVFEQWLDDTRLPLLAWSSQARGFFTGRAGIGKTDDPELVRCWYSPDNFERRERAIELARRKGVQPISIAAAYVLSQRFPTFALIGPLQVSETAGSLEAFSCALTPEEILWLNLET